MITPMINDAVWDRATLAVIDPVSIIQHLRYIGLNRASIGQAIGVGREIVGKWERGDLSPGTQSRVMLLILVNLLDAWEQRAWPVMEFTEIIQTEGIKGALFALL